MTGKNKHVASAENIPASAKNRRLRFRDAEDVVPYGPEPRKGEKHTLSPA